jgi:predicted GIY-YIG superfamily endonuclease
MGFEHWIYVVRCADGTLYTGYATDVRRRVAAHNAGAGAKYTKTRRPVELVACERFYSKRRALSAEAYFKQLSRAEKDAALASGRPLSETLSLLRPAFASEPVEEFVVRTLARSAEPAYADFMARLVPTLPRSRFVGVRTPALRKLGIEVARCPDRTRFFAALPHATFEEAQVHSFAIANEKDHAAREALYEAFLPHVDNWAVCDSLAVAPLLEDPAQAREFALARLASPHAYTVRFGILTLMKGFLGERFDPADFDRVAGAGASVPEGPDTRYVLAGKAWYLAEAFAVRPGDARAWFASSPVDPALAAAARRKALESRRVDASIKSWLKGL